MGTLVPTVPLGKLLLTFQDPLEVSSSRGSLPHQRRGELAVLVLTPSVL